MPTGTQTDRHIMLRLNGYLLYMLIFDAVYGVHRPTVITGSLAGLSRVNGDGPSSAKVVKFYRLPKSPL